MRGKLPDNRVAVRLDVDEAGVVQIVRETRRRVHIDVLSDKALFYFVPHQVSTHVCRDHHQVGEIRVNLGEPSRRGFEFLELRKLFPGVEADNQPDAFPNIIASFWWAIATLTTVGYGDVYPITVMGKILSSIIALLGIGIVAIPTGIISSGFIEELEIETPHIRRMKGLKYSMRKKRGS